MFCTNSGISITEFRVNRKGYAGQEKNKTLLKVNLRNTVLFKIGYLRVILIELSNSLKKKKIESEYYDGFIRIAALGTRKSEVQILSRQPRA